MKIWERIKCFFLGHSHPWFICTRCGRPSKLAFERDSQGNLVRDERGIPRVIRVGWFK